MNSVNLNNTLKVTSIIKEDFIVVFHVFNFASILFFINVVSDAVPKMARNVALLSFVVW